MTRSVAIAACFLLSAVATCGAAAPSRADRRDGVLPPPPPSCDGRICDLKRPFRFRGGRSF